jgi:hypothetical protein
MEGRMSENPEVKAVLEYVETRERELVEQAAQIRARVEELTAQLAELDAESENLRVNRKTLLALPAPTSASEPDRRRPRSPCLPADPYCSHRRRAADAGPRAVPGPRLADPPEEHRRIRSKLKRLVARGILAELEPGLFAQPGT